MYSKIFSILSALVLLALTLSAADRDRDRDQLIEAVENLSRQHQALSKSIDELRKILEMGLKADFALDGLSPLDPVKNMSQRTQIRTEDGIAAFKEKQYEEAKEAFQKAWEEDPNSHVTNYNLGLAYQKLGNIALAKKMLKTALEMDPKLPQAKKIRAYLEGNSYASGSDDELSDEEKKLSTELTNLKNEADSYMHSQGLSLPKRRAATVKVLREMVAKAQKSEKMQQEHLLHVAKSYALFELFDETLRALADYEKSMKDQVLPEEFHADKLKAEEDKQKLDHVLEGYVDNTPKDDIKRKLHHDFEELEIFASQIDEFVQDPTTEDPDFAKITKRLAEFRWGNQPNRHVLVANRFEELLFSSLEGTLPLDRYQDAQGNRFLKNITHLADRMKLKDVAFFEVDLAVNNETIPYVILFTYVPRHELFIIVRLPRKDLV